MTWRYQAFHVTAQGEDWYEVREVYLGLNEDGTDAYTEDAVTATSETKAGLVKVLLRMADDVMRFPAIEGKP